MYILLWIAFKSLSLCWQEQLEKVWNSETCVVNCFQIIIFVLTRTASVNHSIFITLLWIAFKSLSLCWQEQPLPSFLTLPTSCELLSNHYLCADKNSILENLLVDYNVVNCFQIIIFVLTRTANFLNIRFKTMLWIAFKSLSLCWQEQRKFLSKYLSTRCELLSNHYLCADKNSCNID